MAIPLFSFGKSDKALGEKYGDLDKFSVSAVPVGDSTDEEAAAKGTRGSKAATGLTPHQKKTKTLFGAQKGPGSKSSASGENEQPAVAGGSGGNNGRGNGNGERGDGEIKDNVNVPAHVFKDMCSLCVKHDWALTAYYREENCCVVGPDDCAYMMAMSHYVKSYDQVAKDKPVPAGSTVYQGHPEGIRPVALFRHFLFRFSQVLSRHVTNIEDQSEIDTEVLTAATDIVASAGEYATDSNLTCTRCFFVRFINEDKVKMTKWIFACNQDIPLMTNFRVFKNFNTLDVVKLSVQDDNATLTKEAKNIRKYIQGTGGQASGSSRRSRKSRR